VNFAWIKAVMADDELTGGAKVVAFVLAEGANDDGVCRLSREKIAAAGGCSVTSVKRGLAILRMAEYITVGGQIGRQNGLQIGLQIGRQNDPITTGGAKLDAKMTPPCLYPLSPGNKTNIEEREFKKTRTNKSLTANTSQRPPRWQDLWDHFNSVRFVTKAGPLETVRDNVTDPEALCDYLSGPDFTALNLGESMRSAANWTTLEKKNRRDKLGLFLRNWFRNALKDTRENSAKTGATFKPRYHEPFPEPDPRFHAPSTNTK